MNGQIVLCKGVNDREELDHTIRDMTKYLPYMQSASVVPVGLSRYRDGLYPLKPFEKEDAENAIDIIEKWQKIIYEQYGKHFIHASDEFYILAERSCRRQSVTTDTRSWRMAWVCCVFSTPR